VAPADSAIEDVRSGETVCTISDSGLVEVELPPMSWHWLRVS